MEYIRLDAEWKNELDKEKRKNSYDHFYFAAMIAEMRRSWVDKPGRVGKLETFLLKFEDKKTAEEKPEKTISSTKPFWRRFLATKKPK